MVRVNLRVDAFWHGVMALALVSSLLAALVHAGPATTAATSRGIKILNTSGSRVEVYWVNVSGAICSETLTLNSKFCWSNDGGFLTFSCCSIDYISIRIL